MPLGWKTKGKRDSTRSRVAVQLRSLPPIIFLQQLVGIMVVFFVRNIRVSSKHIAMTRIFSFIILALSVMNCATPTRNERPSEKIRLITLDPGHFHAALVQKKMYESVDSTVHVYAPAGPDLDLHLKRISAYNQRADQPTRWNEVVYTGDDFLQRMLKEKKGDVVVMAGNNRNKSEYIQACLGTGLHVLADKPMAIRSGDFQSLKKSFEVAAEKNVLLYDIMTERYEITTMLQRAFSLRPEIFGTLEPGTADNPAVTKESVHHFYKYVSGSVLQRPAWFMDVEQQGNGIVDVTTHLVDLIQWECFPEQVIDYQGDIKLLSARRWPTRMSASEFNAITGMSAFPDYLRKNLTQDSVLRVFSNGEINYRIKGVHARVSVTWAYRAPEGAGDTHYSIMRGTKANLVIRQGAEQSYKPALYIEPVKAGTISEENVNSALNAVAAEFPGIALKPSGNGWEVTVPDVYNEGHEAHFARVMEKFLIYVREGGLPEWEVPNMLAKYYTTTRALEIAADVEAP